MERSSMARRILSVLGRKIPLIRIFKFKKINDISLPHWLGILPIKFLENLNPPMRLK